MKAKSKIQTVKRITKGILSATYGAGKVSFLNTFKVYCKVGKLILVLKIQVSKRLYCSLGLP